MKLVLIAEPPPVICLHHPSNRLNETTTNFSTFRAHYSCVDDNLRAHSLWQPWGRRDVGKCVGRVVGI